MVGDGRLTIRYAIRGDALNASHCSIFVRRLTPSNRFGGSHPPLGNVQSTMALLIGILPIVLAAVVGDGRFELPTSCMSSKRSNQLS